jgi:hypothetical protein
MVPRQNGQNILAKLPVYCSNEMDK